MRNLNAVKERSGTVPSRQYRSLVIYGVMNDLM